MNIKDVIKQRKEFSSKREMASINILFTANWFTEKIVAMLKEYKINDQHYNILRILKGQYPNYLSPGEIKEVLLNKRGDLTRLLDKLVQLELVSRCGNETNRRMVNISITNKGLDLLDTIEV
ncbi:MarR family winged helix-turn-helix transcriptional regulator, partial [Xanthovirga aplysinae]|uniref:MarR family winged helix-turn-helix transcriptional regulator n=1 Tax=Xanthovirga aplysinae TaxID=2529853 RepID=UPI0012BBFF2F